MQVYEIIKKAIKHKKQFHAIYDGLSRKMCPHILGMKNSKQMVFFYQFESSSKKGLKEDSTD